MKSRIGFLGLFLFLTFCLFALIGGCSDDDGSTPPQSGVQSLRAFGVGATEVHLVWERALDLNQEVRDFEILRDSKIIGQRDFEMMAFLDEGLTPLKSYKYTVKGYAENGKYLGQATIFVTTVDPNVGMFHPSSYCTQTCFKKFPYLLYINDPTSMTVAWQASEDITNHGFTWSPTDGSMNLHTESGSHGAADDGSMRYYATLSGLQPETKYQVTVTLDCGSGSGSYSAAFYTAPDASSTKTVSFYAYGDTRVFSDFSAHDRLMSQLWSDVSKNPDVRQSLLLHAGDFVAYGDYDGGGNSVYPNYWNWSFFNDSSNPNTKTMLTHLPVLGTLGNHEYTYNDVDFKCKQGGYIYYKYWPYNMYSNAPLYPAKDGNIGLFYYAFDYGPVHFISIDAYPSADCSGGNPPSQNYSSDTAQYKWLVNDLKSTTKLWKIAFLHIPVYHPDLTDSAAIDNLVPLFKQYDVQVVIQGHVHNYARCVNDGIQYMTLGGGGASLDDIKNPNANGCVASAKKYHFVRFDVSGSTMTVSVIDDEGNAVEAPFNITQ